MIGLVLVAVFLGTTLLVVAGYVAVNRRQLIASDALRARLSPTAPAAVASRILKDEKTSDIGALNGFLAGKEMTAVISNQLERSGSRRSVGEFVLISLLFASLGFLIGRKLGLVAAPFLAVAFAYIPY